MLLPYRPSGYSLAAAAFRAVSGEAATLVEGYSRATGLRAAGHVDGPAPPRSASSHATPEGADRPGALSAAKSGPREIRRRRRARPHQCWNHLVIAPLWVAYTANLGTLLRTCDAVGACLAVPATDHYRQALSIGDSRRIGERCCVHWIDTGKDRWLRLQRQGGWRVVAIELAEGAIALPRLEPARDGRSCCSATRRPGSLTSTSRMLISASRSR